VAVRCEQWQRRAVSVIRNEKTNAGGWRQVGTGTFKVIDATHVKVELQPSWYFGVSVYELAWQDNDHLSLRAADQTTHLTRIK
jgi:hypothetical protein